MPTPSSNPPSELTSRSHSSSCPDEHRASTSWRPDIQDVEERNMDSEGISSTPVSAPQDSAITEDVDDDSQSTTESPRPDSRSGIVAVPVSSEDVESSQTTKPMDTDDDASIGHGHVGPVNSSFATGHGSAAADIVSPMSAEGDKLEDVVMCGRLRDDFHAPSLGYDHSNIRITPTYSSSFLRPGSKFLGTQQSERQQYDVQVEIKYVDLRESFLCGYLKIQGLTEDNPTLTTYFEGEIIGSKYGFVTKHDTWGATEKIDMSHWNKFNAFRPLSKAARKGSLKIADFASQPHLFMRWKEHFLVPDHRVRTINGASFEGFYYICINQVKGMVSGIYFHSKSEKFQQLELKHVEDRGCFGAMEFR